MMLTCRLTVPRPTVEVLRIDRGIVAGPGSLSTELEPSPIRLLQGLNGRQLAVKAQKTICQFM